MSRDICDISTTSLYRPHPILANIYVFSKVLSGRPTNDQFVHIPLLYRGVAYLSAVKCSLSLENVHFALF